MEHTEYCQLSLWDAEDRIERKDFNGDNGKVDAALAAVNERVDTETAARESGDAAAAAADCLVKLVDATLAEDAQQWHIDLSEIDLTKYQKLVICPQLRANNDQWPDLRINGLNSGYFQGDSYSKTTCAELPIMNDPARQNFGVCEVLLFPQLPRIFTVRIQPYPGNPSGTARSYRCPDLPSGVTHLDTLDVCFDSSSYRILSGSTLQVYGVRR